MTLSAIALIRQNLTGEVREYKTELMLYSNGAPDVSIWEEGNFSCDCNRELFFDEAGGDENESNEEPTCGNTRYSVNIKRLSGEVIYKEFDY